MDINLDATLQEDDTASNSTGTIDTERDNNHQPLPTTEPQHQQLSEKTTSLTTELSNVYDNNVIHEDSQPVNGGHSELMPSDINGTNSNDDKTTPIDPNVVDSSIRDEKQCPISSNDPEDNLLVYDKDGPTIAETVVDNVSPKIDQPLLIDIKNNTTIVTSSIIDDNDIVPALQENLQHQMTAKAEAEDKVRRMESKIILLEEQLKKQQDEIFKYDELQENIQLQLTAKAEAEHKARSAYDRVQQLEIEKETNIQDLKRTQQQLCEAREMIADKDRELDKVRCDRDEYERKVTVLTTRLNAVKKQEAVKVNHVDEIEDDLKVTTEELEQTKHELEITKKANSLLEQKLQYLENISKEHIEHLEKALADERRLNEERKQKMKEYVDTKTEELRQAKEYNDSLQIELTQTNRSFVELNNRWKQLHTQWVQAQTHNRELQRDLNRTKKDSEHLHKQGDTLEMKLSRSANETEEHKTKRLAAKQELMSVLRALEVERDVTTKLRDQIKFTFVPKVLNQQQTLNDILHEFSSSLEKLSIRLGKPLPPIPDETERDASMNVNVNGSYNKTAIAGDIMAHPEINPLIEKLDNESQRVSVAITSVANNVERLRALVQASGDRTCFTVLSELISSGGMESASPALRADRPNIPNPLTSMSRSHRYGQIPGASD
jgi:myosin heavy subunit